MSLNLILKVSLVATVLLAFAVFGSANAEDSIKVFVAGKETSNSNTAILLDGTLYIPLSLVKSFGVEVRYDSKRKGDSQEIKLIPNYGKEFETVSKQVNKKWFVPIREIAPQIGISATYDEDAKTLNILALIQTIDFDGTELQINTTFPVEYTVSWWKAGNKLIVTPIGVDMPRSRTNAKLINSTEISIRIGKDVVVDMPCPVEYRMISAAKSSIIALSVTGLPSPAISSQAAPAISVQPSDQSVPEPPIPPSSQVEIRGVEIRKSGTRRIEVYVDTNNPVSGNSILTSMTRQPDRLMIDVSRVLLPKPIEDIAVEGKILRNVHIEPGNADSVRLTLALDRIVCFDVASEPDSSGITIGLDLPKGAGGLLSEKVIVIDPGHGGAMPGCKGLNDTLEKDVNLEIAMSVRKLLAKAGACALITRDDDKELDSNLARDLEKRVEYAVRHSADFFISIHENSCIVPGDRTGTETYYHFNDPSGRALAECLHPEIVKVLALPDASVRADSDGRGKGFSVLRNSSRNGLPAVLMEMGFLNHPDDFAKITDPATQQKIAEAIVQGIRTYVEGNIPDTASIKAVRKNKSVGVKQKPVPKKITSKKVPKKVASAGKTTSATSKGTKQP